MTASTKRWVAALGLVMLVAFNAVILHLLAHDSALYALGLFWSFASTFCYGWQILGPAFRVSR